MELQSQKHNFKELNRNKRIEIVKQQPVNTRKPNLKKADRKQNPILTSLCTASCG